MAAFARRRRKLYPLSTSSLLVVSAYLSFILLVWIDCKASTPLLLVHGFLSSARSNGFSVRHSHSRLQSLIRQQKIAISTTRNDHHHNDDHLDFRIHLNGCNLNQLNCTLPRRDFLTSTYAATIAAALAGSQPAPADASSSTNHASKRS